MRSANVSNDLNVPYVKSKEQYIPPEINSVGLCYYGFVKHDDEELGQFCSSTQISPRQLGILRKLGYSSFTNKTIKCEIKLLEFKQKDLQEKISRKALH